MTTENLHVILKAFKDSDTDKGLDAMSDIKYSKLKTDTFMLRLVDSADIHKYTDGLIYTGLLNHKASLEAYNEIVAYGIKHSEHSFVSAHDNKIGVYLVNPIGIHKKIIDMCKADPATFASFYFDKDDK